MTDVTTTIATAIGIPTADLAGTPAVPSLFSTLVHDYSQKALTALSVWAIAHGVSPFLSAASTLTGETGAQLTGAAVQIGVGAAGLALSCAWTLIIAYLRKEKMTALLNFIPTNA